MKILQSNKTFKKNKGWNERKEGTKRGPWNLYVMFLNMTYVFWYCQVEKNDIILMTGCGQGRRLLLPT